jgi:type IV secretion system protein VirB6
MNAAVCQQALDSVGSGVAASLRAVDCAAGATAQAAFGRLFGSGGALVPALTILLTIYVAFFAFSLITGRSRLGVSALTPRMMTVGLVLTFATSWLAYQSVVWNLAVGAPDQLAAILTGVKGSSTQVFADKIDVVFAALVDSAGAQSNESVNTFSPPGLMWLGATLLLLGTVGVLATSKIALAILLALGPVFVVLALFPGTRGLFTGWLKGVVMLALAPLFAVLGGSLMLELAVPVLRTLTQTPGQIDARAAMAFFMIGAVHAALMLMIFKVAGTMVAGWEVFGLASPRERASDARPAPAATQVAVAQPAAASTATDTARIAASAAARDIRLTPTLAAANDAGRTGTGSTRRETRIIGGGVVAPAPGADFQPSRARGIGSRFRAPPARSMEKFK